MLIGKSIYEILSNDIKVSNSVANRIFPNVAAPTTIFPFIIYNVGGDNPTNDKDGVSSLDTNSVMVSCYDTSYSKVSTLANDIREALDRLSGTYGGIEIQSITYDGYNDLFDNDSDGRGVYRKALDFKIRLINN